MAYGRKSSIGEAAESLFAGHSAGRISISQEIVKHLGTREGP